MLAVSGRGCVEAFRLLVQEPDDRTRRLFIAVDRNERAVVRRDREKRTRSRIDHARNGAEIAFDQALDLSLVEISYGDDRHYVRPIPGVIEATQGRRLVSLQNRLQPDRQPFGVLGSREENREPFILHPVFSALPQAPLLDYNRSFLFYLGGLKRDVVCPLRQNLKSLVDNRGRVGRNRDHVHRFIEAGECIDVWPVSHPH